MSSSDVAYGEAFLADQLCHFDVCVAAMASVASFAVATKSSRRLMKLEDGTHGGVTSTSSEPTFAWSLSSIMAIASRAVAST